MKGFMSKDDHDTAAPRGMIHQFVGAGDFCERDAFSDFDAGPACLERGIQIARRLNFRLRRKIADIVS